MDLALNLMVHSADPLLHVGLAFTRSCLLISKTMVPEQRKVQRLPGIVVDRSVSTGPKLHSPFQGTTMLCNVFGIYHNFITRSHCFNNWSLSTRGMILVVSNVVYSSQYMGWTRGVDNATLFSCLLPGSVPAPVARVLSMMNAHTIAELRSRRSQ